MDAIRRELNKMPIDDTVVIGKGERDKAPMLFIGERVGNNNGPKVDIAVDPLWHDTLRQGHAGSNRDNGDGRRQLVNAPEYMQKIAIGPGQMGLWRQQPHSGQNNDAIFARI